MNKNYILEKLAQWATPDSTGVSIDKKTPTKNPNGYTPPDTSKNLDIAKRVQNGGTVKKDPFANSASAAKLEYGNKIQSTYGKKETPKPMSPHQEAKNTPGPRASATSKPPVGNGSSNGSGNSGGSFASSFDAYSKRPDAKIGDTFEHNGKKYKFEYADKKKNEEFTKNKQSAPAPDKSYDKSKNQLEYKTNIDIKGSGTPESVQKLPMPQVANKPDFTKLAPITMGGQSQAQLAKK